MLKILKSSSKSDCILISKYNPLTLSKGTIFDDKKFFKTKELKTELLDKVASNEFIFTLYEDISQSKDSPAFFHSNLKMSLFSISPKFLGREFAKTCSFLTVDDFNNFKHTLLQITDGYGFVILESTNLPETEVKLIKATKKSLIYVPKGFSFTIINASDKANLIVTVLHSRESEFRNSILANHNGTILYYTKKGFIRNNNSSPYYVLNEYRDNYLEKLKLDTEKNLYEEFLKTPKSFDFLNK